MKKNLISIIILALLIVNIVLTSVMMFSVMSTNKKTAKLVTDIASAISLELGEEEEGEPAEVVPMEDTQTYTIADLRILLKKAEPSAEGEADEDDHYALLNVTLSMNSKHKDYKTYSDLSTREDLIKGQINDVVSQYTLDQAKESNQQIEDEILNKIQTLFDSDFIFDVTLSSYLYQ